MSSAAYEDTTRTGWFKSTFSSSSTQCVEVRFGADDTGVRDSKHPHTDTPADPTLAVRGTQWAAFLHHVRG